MDDAILDEESEEIESDVDRFLHGNWMLIQERSVIGHLCHLAANNDNKCHILIQP
jgi:hypothetical protein